MPAPRHLGKSAGRAAVQRRTPPAMESVSDEHSPGATDVRGRVNPSRGAHRRRHPAKKHVARFEPPDRVRQAAQIQSGLSRDPPLAVGLLDVEPGSLDGFIEGLAGQDAVDHLLERGRDPIRSGRTDSQNLAVRRRDDGWRHV